ncbi:MAG TPA: type II toxin-antitoxin system RelE/ParE family toxin [Acidobacteriaceae bacterium]|jgi:addiction module RelE/StbE family toxin
MRLYWSEASLRDRDEIFDYIEADNPEAAVEVDLRIREQTSSLIRFPSAGRPGRVRGTRELVIQGTSHIVAYRIERDRIRILRVLHGAQLWPPRF